MKGQSRGYRCIVPGCLRRVAYGYVPRLFCEPCWVAIDTEITSALVAAFQDVRRKRPGSLNRYAEAKRACQNAAAAAGVIPQHPQAGDGAAVTRPPDVHPPSRPANPPAAVSSPQHPAPDLADGASPVAGEQVGGVPRPGRCGTPPSTTDHT